MKAANNLKSERLIERAFQSIFTATVIQEAEFFVGTRTVNGEIFTIVFAKDPAESLQQRELQILRAQIKARDDRNPF